jgi:hypothetical protein
MLSIERILEISKQNGVLVNKEIDGTHYILNKEGKKVPFESDMLMGGKITEHTCENCNNWVDEYIGGGEFDSYCDLGVFVECQCACTDDYFEKKK